MRIAMVSEHASPLAALGGVDAGGQNVHVAALARGLAELGNQVTVYTRRDAADTPERTAAWPGVEVVQVDAGPARAIPKDELLPFMPAFADQLLRYWRDDPPQVVHGHFWMSGVAAVSAARRSPHAVAVFETFHALGSVKRRHQGADDTSPAERATLEPEVGRQVDSVIATCSDEVAELRALGVPAERIAVVPCGVDVAALTPEGPAERRGRPHRLVCLGRMVPRKGVDLVIRALPFLLAAGLNTELVVAGGGPVTEGATDPELARLREVARGVGVDDRVSFRGPIDRDAVAPLLRSASAVVCAPWYEPFGIVPLEAMASGVPIVGAAVGGLLDSVVDGETGLLVPPRDVGALAAALVRLLRDPALGARLGLQGRVRAVERYSWERVAADTLAVYARVLNQHDKVAPAAVSTRGR